jgi:hypothetical protein
MVRDARNKGLVRPAPGQSYEELNSLTLKNLSRLAS